MNTEGKADNFIRMQKEKYQYDEQDSNKTKYINRKRQHVLDRFKSTNPTISAIKEKKYENDLLNIDSRQLIDMLKDLHSTSSINFSILDKINNPEDKLTILEKIFRIILADNNAATSSADNMDNVPLDQHSINLLLTIRAMVFNIIATDIQDSNIINHYFRDIFDRYSIFFPMYDYADPNNIKAQFKPLLQSILNHLDLNQYGQIHTTYPLSSVNNPLFQLDQMTSLTKLSLLEKLSTKDLFINLQWILEYSNTYLVSLSSAEGAINLGKTDLKNISVLQDVYAETLIKILDNSPTQPQLNLVKSFICSASSDANQLNIISIISDLDDKDAQKRFDIILERAELALNKISSQAKAQF